MYLPPITTLSSPFQYHFCSLKAPHSNSISAVHNLLAFNPPIAVPKSHRLKNSTAMPQSVAPTPKEIIGQID